MKAISDENLAVSVQSSVMRPNRIIELCVEDSEVEIAANLTDFSQELGRKRTPRYELPVGS